MEALHNLGIDWKLLLAQVVNFLILLFILRKFAYRPMLEFLDKRTARIEQGLKDAKEAKAKLLEIEEKEKDILRKAHEEGKAIVARAVEAAEKRGNTTIAEMEKKAKAMLAEAEKSIVLEREQMLREAKDEIAEVVLAAVEKVLREKTDATKDRELLERFLQRNDK